MEDKSYALTHHNDVIIQLIRKAINTYGPSPDEIAYELRWESRDDVVDMIDRTPELARLHLAWVDRIVQTVRATNGNRKLICAHLGCEREAIDIWSAQNPSIKRALLNAEEELIDLGEQVLMEFVMRRDWKATQFLLETKGKHRGYTKAPKSTLNQEADRLGLSWTQIRDELAGKIASQIMDDKAGDEKPSE